MATWEDGPEYAPLVPPDQFVEPAVAPLEQVPPGGRLLTSAPDQLPVFTPAAHPGLPLDQINPSDGTPRDPTEPFDIATATMTESTSAWSSARGTRATTGVDPTWAPPTTAPVAGAFPPPAPGGTVSFAPPPPGAHPAVEVRYSVPQALTVGYLVALAASIIVPIAPLTLVLAVILSRQARAAQTAVRTAAIAALVVFAIVVVVTVMSDPITFGVGWMDASYGALIIAALLLIASIALVLRAHGRPDAPGRQGGSGSWG